MRGSSKQTSELPNINGLNFRMVILADHTFILIIPLFCGAFTVFTILCLNSQLGGVLP